MIVVDTSAVIEALVGAAPDEGLLAALSGDVEAPHVLDVEVMSVLRGLVLGGKLDAGVAEAARADFFDLTIHRHEVAPHAERIWGLRHQFTAYDAAYISLAEALRCPLHTCDRKLRTPGHEATVTVLPLTG